MSVIFLFWVAWLAGFQFTNGIADEICSMKDVMGRRMKWHLIAKIFGWPYMLGYLLVVLLVNLRNPPAKSHPGDEL